MTEATTPAENGNGKKPKGKPIRLIVLLVVAAALAAVAYFFFYAPVPEEKEIPKPPTTAVDMGVLVVNLADGTGGRYLRLSVVVEIPEDKLVQDEFKKREHRIRHGFLTTLRHKTSADVRSLDSMDAIRADLLDELNRHLTTGEAQNVFFTEYMVQ